MSLPLVALPAQRLCIATNVFHSPIGLIQRPFPLPPRCSNAPFRELHSFVNFMLQSHTVYLLVY